MDTTLVAGVVAGITDGWSVGPGGRAADLHTARLALAAAADIGIPAVELDPALPLKPAAALNASLSTAIATALAAPPSPRLAFVESALSGGLTNPLGTPAWARGMRATQRLGPFVDVNGVGHNVIIVPLTVSRKFAFGAPGAPFGVFPVNHGGILPTAHLTLGHGSVWFLAKLLAPTIADGNFAGFRISGGALQSSTPMTLQGDTWVIPPSATLTLTATLMPPAAGAGSPGADLTTAGIALPGTATIAFTANAATVQALADAQLKLYGTSRTFAWSKQAPVPVSDLPWLLVPYAPSGGSFSFSTVHSTTFRPSGSAPIEQAGWALPLAVTTITALGEASGAGALFLILGAGAHLALSIRAPPAAIARWLISIDPTALGMLAGGTGKAGHRSIALWPEADGRRHASVDWRDSTAFGAFFLATPGKEVVATGGNAVAHLDRPLAADGGRLPIAGPAILIETIEATTDTLAIIGVPQPTADIYPLALPNALIGVRLPRLFQITAPLVQHQAVAAQVTLLFDARWLLPTCPDPYAANFDTAMVRQQGDQGVGSLGIVLKWSQGEPVAIALGIGPSLAQAMPAQAMLAAAHPGDTAAAASATAVADTATLAATRASSGLALLDLSTRVDQFGVAIVGFARDQGQSPAPAVGFVDLFLAVNDAEVATFALPQLSWEPMESTGPAPPLGPVIHTPAGDGPPLLLRAADEQQLVPFAPLPVLLRNIDNVAAGKPIQAVFSLPFGLIANLDQPNAPPRRRRKASFLQAGGRFELVQPRFPGAVQGALQVMMKPPHPGDPKAQFAGRTQQSADGYGAAVLGSDVAAIFDGEFNGAAGAVPVRRADLLGYGASIWSEWQDRNVPGTGILKTQFETVVGRTRYEVVKAQTHFCPYFPRLVRTVTIERQNTGWVERSDSGWVAATPGIFVFDPLGGWNGRVHRGAVAGVFNIRNIREFETVGPVGAFTFRRALFDADIGIEHRVRVLAGGFPTTETDAFGNPVTLVPARDLSGYVQIAPATDAVGPLPPPLTPAVMAALLALTGPVTASFACTVEIGGTPTKRGTVLRCTGIEVDMALSASGGAPVPALAVALRGAPALPRDGAWGIGRRLGTATAPAALPKDFAVPLVQPTSDPGTWHFADITDVLRLDSPFASYGLLQDTGTQKLLFEQPTVADLSGGAPPGVTPGLKLPPGAAPVFADVASLLNATGLFPDLASAISLVTGAAEQLDTLEQGLHYTKSYTFSTSAGPNTLLDLGAIKVALSYADESKPRDAGGHTPAPTVFTFKLDPAHTEPDGAGRNWWFTIAPITFLVSVPLFGSDPLLFVTGGFVADDRTKPTLSDLNIVYGSALSSLKAIFSRLEALAAFLPGGAGAGLDVSLSEGRLTVRESFAIPTLPLGLGELSDISLDLGLALTLSPLAADFTVGIGGPQNPFNWIVSPLAGNGFVDVGVKGGKPLFGVQGGIGLGLAIDIGIAEGSASVTIAVRLDVAGSAVTLMAILSGQASVQVLGGLVGASLTLTAAVGITVNPLPIPVVNLLPPGISFPAEDITFLAAVSVGIHISICWVVSVDWDGSWQFSQSIHTPAITVQT